jgi:hypothetical protein
MQAGRSDGPFRTGSDLVTTGGVPHRLQDGNHRLPCFHHLSFGPPPYHWGGVEVQSFPDLLHGVAVSTRLPAHGWPAGVLHGLVLPEKDALQPPEKEF